MGMIQDFQKADKERRSEVDTMHSGVATMLKELATEDIERRSQVATMLNEADTFVKDLAKGSTRRRSEVTDIRSEVAVMLRDFAAQAQERKATVASIANEATAIVEEADTFVKDLARSSAERASEVAAIHEEVWGKAPAKKRVVLPKVAPMVGKLSGDTKGVVVEEAPAGELRDRVFAYLANHPDGTRLTELEKRFGVARIQIARVIRVLIDDNKVEKRDLLYFAI